MIVNHRYRFIFLKTRKTAGTSIEIALSRFCEKEDTITPISPEDELTRKALGHRGPQHYQLPLRSYDRSDFLDLIRKRRRKVFFNHAPAAFIRANLPANVWNSYYKFCFERNPYDKAISRYYWSTRTAEQRPPVSLFLREAPRHLLSDWNIYTLDGRIAVDFVGDFERIDQDLTAIGERLGLPGRLDLPKAKGAYRSDRRHYSQVLGPTDRAHIEEVCASEIAAFGYRWEEMPESTSKFAT